MKKRLKRKIEKQEQRNLAQARYNFRTSVNATAAAANNFATTMQSLWDGIKIPHYLFGHMLSDIPYDLSKERQVLYKLNRLQNHLKLMNDSENANLINALQEVIVNEHESLRLIHVEYLNKLYEYGYIF